MKVFIAADHAGFVKKQQLATRLSQEFDLVDLGPKQLNPEDDFPVFAKRVADSVIENQGSLGVLVCKSGQGMEIAANKIDGIRAALAWNKQLAKETRSDNDSNVLSLASGELSIDEMYEIAKTFLNTPFSEAERHTRRINEIKNIEESQS